MEFWRRDDGIYLQDWVATFVKTLAFDETLVQRNAKRRSRHAPGGDRGVGGGHVGSMRLRAAAKLIWA